MILDQHGKPVTTMSMKLIVGAMLLAVCGMAQQDFAIPWTVATGAFKSEPVIDSCARGVGWSNSPLAHDKQWLSQKSAMTVSVFIEAPASYSEAYSDAKECARLFASDSRVWERRLRAWGITPSPSVYVWRIESQGKLIAYKRPFQRWVWVGPAK